MAFCIDRVTVSAYRTTSALTFRAARPIVWIRDVSERRKPSLSASRMQTIETSGRSSPSRSRLTPTRASKAPSRSSRRIWTRSKASSSEWSHLVRGPLLLEVPGEVLGEPLGQGRDQDALAALGPLADLAEQRRDLAAGRLDADDRVDQAGRADDLLDDLAAGHLDLVVAGRRRDEDAGAELLLPLVEPEGAVVQGARQAEAVLDEGALAAEVAGEHPADLGDGHVRLVDEHQSVLREEVEQRVRRRRPACGRRGAGCSSRSPGSSRPPGASRCRSGSGPRAAGPPGACPPP